MENRLIYFAVETSVEDFKKESQNKSDVNFKQQVESEDSIKKLGKESQQQGVDLTHGGKLADSQARMLRENPNVTEVAKENLKNKQSDLASALAEVRSSNTPENIKKANQKIEALKKLVNSQLEKSKEAASLSKSYENLLSIPNAKTQIGDDFEVAINGKKASKIKGLLELKDFRNLSNPNKEKYYQAIKEKLLNPEKEGENKNLEAMRDKLLGDRDIPKSWKDWLKNPKSWGEAKNEEEKTLEYAVKWINENVGELKHQVAKYEKFTSENSLDLNKASITPQSLDAFRNLSRSERNEYLDGLKSKVAQVNESLASKMDNLKVSDDAKTQAIETHLDKTSEDAEKAEDEKYTKLAKDIQDSPLRKKLMQQVEKEKEVVKNQKEDVLVDDVAKLRSGEAQEGFLKRMFKRKEKQSDEDKEREEAQTHESASNNVVKEILEGEKEEAREGEAKKENPNLSDAEKQQVKEMFKFKELPKKEELGIALQVLTMKNTSKEDVEKAMKKNRDILRGKVDFAL